MAMTGLVKQCAQGAAQRRKHARFTSLEHAPLKVTFGFVLLEVVMRQCTRCISLASSASLSDDPSSA